MSRRNALDPNQMTLDFNAQVDVYVDVKGELVDSASRWLSGTHGAENEFEACIEIAAAIKRTLRDSGMSREQLVDGINGYFGRSEQEAAADPASCRKPLTIHMLNNYLSKPTEYPIPAYYLYAIHHVTGIVEPGATIVAAEGAHVVTAEENRLLQLGRLEKAMDEMSKLKRKLKGSRR